MEMILNKFLMVTLIMSILNVGRHIVLILLIYTKPEEEREPYLLDLWSKIILGLSISFIVSSIFTGLYI